jgi:hypothetical protein
MILNINVREKAHYLHTEFGVEELTEAPKFADIPDGKTLVVVSGEWVQAFDTEDELRIALFNYPETIVTFRYFLLNSALVKEMSAVE